MWQKLFNALRNLPGPVIAGMGAKLSAQLVHPFRGTTAKALYAEMKAFATTPSKTRSLLAAIAAVGGTVELAQLADGYISGEGAESGLSGREQLLLDQRRRVVGDGDSSTIVGMNPDSYAAVAEMVIADEAMITNMLRKTGLSVDGFVALRNAILSLEDEQIATYIAGRIKRNKY